MESTTQAPIAPVRIVTVLRAGITPQPPARCSGCPLKDTCLPQGLDQADLQRLDRLMFGRRRVKAGQALFREGDRFQFLYAVRSGTLKTSVMLRDGREQITGFSIAGELVGIDGLGQGTHGTSAVALEDGEVCAIPAAHLRDAAAESRQVQAAVTRLLGREIVRNRSLMMLLGSMGAEERLAAFLLNLSQRLQSRGYSPTEFHLRMGRADIGSYLGLTLETVSRTLSAFQQRGLLTVDRRHVRIADLASLSRIIDMRLQ